MKSLNELSIRRQLFYWLLIPLVAVWLGCTVFAWYVALQLSHANFDRELINSADSIVARLHAKDGKATVDELSPAVMAILAHNKDQFFFRVLKPDGTVLIPDNNLPPPDLSENLGIDEYKFDTVHFRGQVLRTTVTKLDLEDPKLGLIILQVGETQLSRREMANQILAGTVVPEVMMIVFSFIAVWIGVSRGLHPLRMLQVALASRSQFDLRPLPLDNVASELRPLVHALNNLLERLREDIEAQRRFVANAAHQLRTPLAGLKAHVELGRRRVREKKSEDAFDQVEVGLDKVTHLANRLLALAKAEPKPSAEDQYAELELNKVVADATSDLVNLAIDKNIDLSFEPALVDATIYGDAHALGELIVNLVENAILYTHSGGKVVVAISVDQRVSLSVEDNGPGIPPAERTRVFERFYRILGNGSAGCGLGLSIVQEIARAHNADIWVDSGIDGQGTKFIVVFPVKSPAPMASTATV